MVRNYVRKTCTGPDRGNPSHALVAAIEEVKTGVPVNFASLTYGIPETTLRRYAKKDSNEYPVHGGRFKKVLSTNLEQQLSAYLQEMGSRGFGLTPVQVREFAFEIAERNQLQNRFKAESRKAGLDWFKSFLGRNPEITIRAPEATSIGRLAGFNKPQVDRFFQLLADVMKTHSFSASRIFNCVESGLPTVPTKLQKVVAQKGARRVPKVTSAERGRNITVVCSMNAAGYFVPPVFIFPRKRFRSELLVGAPPDSDGFCNESGWMNNATFIQYLQHFAKHTRPSKEDQILLIVDNHASHISLDAVDFCRDHGIVLLSLPPHCTHRIQPLDVSFFGPLKKYYSQQCDAWMTKNPGKAITEYHVAGLFADPYAKAATVGIAISGFRSTGIFPYDRNVFTDADFTATATTERSEPQAVQVEANAEGRSVLIALGLCLTVTRKIEHNCYYYIKKYFNCIAHVLKHKNIWNQRPCVICYAII